MTHYFHLQLIGKNLTFDSKRKAIRKYNPTKYLEDNSINDNCTQSRNRDVVKRISLEYEQL